MTSIRFPWGRVLGVAALAASLGACNYVNSVGPNPNDVTDATLDQLYTGVQAGIFFDSEDNTTRLSSIFTQQMAGTDRQFSQYDTYVLKESDVDAEFNNRYEGGGLIDVRKAENLATSANRMVYAGILKVYEAYLMGEMSSMWGDLPYSEAVNPDIKTPKLDKQEDVYAAIQALLDDAIANLQSGTGAGPGSADLVFSGDAQKWLAVAHTLKARFYMHWVEAQKAGMTAAQTACGGDCEQLALAQTQQGITDAAGNWITVHTTAQTETNIWYQFMNDRSGYIHAGNYLVTLLQNRNDPRMSIFFSKDADGQYLGSKPGENLSSASVLSTSGVGAPNYHTPIATCSENAFIAAEANYDMGNMAAARQGLDAGVACQDANFGVTIPYPSSASLSGAALLDEIMTQKYIAEFLNVEAWNDYKRTCLPVLQTFEGKPIPGRLIYGQQERQTNPNIPEPSAQPARNTNDPQGCPAS